MSSPRSPSRPILKRRNSNNGARPVEDLPLAFESSLVLNSSTCHKSVQFSPNRNAISQVFETHSSEAYDRKPISPSPLSPDELRGENSPLRFLDPARRKVVQAQRSNGTRAPHPEDTRVDALRRSHRRESFRAGPEDVIFEEEEEEEIVDAIGIIQRAKLVPMAPRHSPSFVNSFAASLVRESDKFGNGHHRGVRADHFGGSNQESANFNVEQEIDDFFASPRLGDSQGTYQYAVFVYQNSLVCIGTFSRRTSRR